ncbi:MAG TPA: hypothetical protein VL614_21270 [Acetobacteraceae bacterium]|nr:hypothetical protein [Acetobacteraceae bacterium]
MMKRISLALVVLIGVSGAVLATAALIAQPAAACDDDPQPHST